MMAFFKRQSSKQGIAWPLILQAAKTIDRQQHQWANYLNKKTNSSNRLTIIIALISFCLLAGVVCIMIIANAVNKNVYGTAIDKLTVPSHLILQDSPISQPVQPAYIKQYQDNYHDKNYADSFGKSTRLGVKYDSAFKSRPGMLDSLLFLEQFIIHH